MRSRFSHFVILENSTEAEHLVDGSIATPRWRWLLNLGIGFLIAGLVAIALPQLITSAINVLLGSILLTIGLITGIYAIQSRFYSYDRWPWFTSLILILCGLLLLFNPKVGAVSITLIIAVFLIFTGIGKVSLAQIVKPVGSWNWILLSGLVDLCLSFLIFFNLSDASDWLLGLLIGISLIMQGWWNIRLALSLRKLDANIYDVA